ncbi:Hpt domain-containing protein [Planctomicrobium sp. SH668]|uniref:Hpt domain-containing protein n=1 Tax=Planctomicrobium sp. SH668 TaxID=3448126 RepID=UPI003F5B56D9
MVTNSYSRQFSAPAQLTPSTELCIEVPALLARCIGNRELASRLIERFLQSTSDLCLKIQNAIAAEDLEVAGMLAHRLKGEAANLGATRIRDRSAEVEVACRKCDFSSAHAAAQALKAESQSIGVQLPLLVHAVNQFEPDQAILTLPKRTVQ